MYLCMYISTMYMIMYIQHYIHSYAEARISHYIIPLCRIVVVAHTNFTDISFLCCCSILSLRHWIFCWTCAKLKLYLYNKCQQSLHIRCSVSVMDAYHTHTKNSNSKPMNSILSHVSCNMILLLNHATTEIKESRIRIQNNRKQQSDVQHKKNKTCDTVIEIIITTTTTPKQTKHVIQ